MRRRWERIPPVAWALVAAVVVIGAVGGKWLWPWLTREAGVVVATPVAPARFQLSTVELKRGEVACVENAVIPSDAAVYMFAGSLPPDVEARRAPRLEVRASGDGWRARGEIPRGWPHGLSARLDPPPRDVVGRVCLRNRGHVTAVLNANAEPGATGRAFSTHDGKRTDAAINLQLLRGEPASRLSRLGEMVERATSFSWAPLGKGFGLVLLVLVVVLTPLCAVGAVLWAMAGERRSDGPRDDDGYPGTP